MRRMFFTLLSAAALVLSALAPPAVGAADAPAAAEPQTVTVRYGPYTIPGGSEEDPGVVFNQMRRDMPLPCKDCDIISAVPDLTDEAGDSVDMTDGQMLHHMVLYQMNARDVACPNSPVTFGMRRLAASGEERTPLKGPAGFGLHVGPSDRWALLADLMNHAPEAKTVYVTMKFTYLPGSTLRPLTPVWLDATGCGASYMFVPKGEWHRATTLRSRISGKVVGIGGHVHEHGINVKATNVTTNTEICDSVATYHTMPDGHPMLTDMGECTGNPYITRISAGDGIRLDTYYDSPHRIFGGMGIMVMYVDENPPA